MTWPQVEALFAEWADLPPLRVLMAAFVGFKKGGAARGSGRASSAAGDGQAMSGEVFKNKESVLAALGMGLGGKVRAPNKKPWDDPVIRAAHYKDGPPKWWLDQQARTAA